MDPADDIERRVCADIAAYGWHVVLVPGDEGAPAWAYTIGLLETLGHPELAMFGTDVEQLHAVLNHAGALVRAGRTFEPGEHAGIFQDLPCAMRPVDPRWHDVFFGNAAWHYQRPDVPILQCFWPDAGGRFPWQPGFAATWRADQPLLFHSQVEAALPPTLADTLRNEGAL